MAEKGELLTVRPDLREQAEAIAIRPMVDDYRSAVADDVPSALEGNLADVLDLLGGRLVGPIGWQEGVERTYKEEGTVVATPLLAGVDECAWLLVVGRWVAASRDSVDIAALSAALNCEVQLFVTHRVVDLHRWERAIGGISVRSFEYIGEAGEVTRWHGDPRDVELAIGLPSTFDINRDSVSDTWVSVREDDVMRVAAAWSIDPTSLDGTPATGTLTLAQFPPAGRSTEPQPKLIAVNVTDLIMSDESIDDKNEKMAWPGLAVGLRRRGRATVRGKAIGGSR